MAAVFYDAGSVLTATVVMQNGSECTSPTEHGIPPFSQPTSNYNIAASKNVIYKCGAPSPNGGNHNNEVCLAAVFN